MREPVIDRRALPLETKMCYGMDALALTDHGNMNGLSYQIDHAKKMMEEGKDFKPIFGVESYFIPSVKDWKKELEKEKDSKKSKKKSKSITSMEFSLFLRLIVIIPTKAHGAIGNFISALAGSVRAAQIIYPQNFLRTWKTLATNFIPRTAMRCGKHTNITLTKLVRLITTR